MTTNKSWQEFRDSGMLWWINTILHIFGWSIGVQIEEDGSISSAVPMRVKFRGFDEKHNTEGYMKVSKYLKENAEELLKEASE